MPFVTKDANDVDVTMASTTENSEEVPHILYSGRSRVKRVTVTRAANTTQYTPGDCYGPKFTVELGRLNDGTGTIFGVGITQNSYPTTRPDLELWLFDTLIADAGDNAAFAPSDAEMKTWLGTICFGNGPLIGLVGTGGNGNMAYLSPLFAMAYKCISGGKLVQGQMVVRNNPTPIANSEEVDLVFHYIQD